MDNWKEMLADLKWKVQTKEGRRKLFPVVFVILLAVICVANWWMQP